MFNVVLAYGACCLFRRGNCFAWWFMQRGVQEQQDQVERQQLDLEARHRQLQQDQESVQSSRGDVDATRRRVERQQQEMRELKVRHPPCCFPAASELLVVGGIPCGQMYTW